MFGVAVRMLRPVWPLLECLGLVQLHFDSSASRWRALWKLQMVAQILRSLPPTWQTLVGVFSSLALASPNRSLGASWKWAGTWGSFLSPSLRFCFSACQIRYRKGFNEMCSLSEKDKIWSTCCVYFIGLKTMVSLGVKNPLLDLTALEDKPLDEVRGSNWSLWLKS